MALKGVNKARPDLRISASDTAGPGASNRGVERKIWTPCTSKLGGGDGRVRGVWLESARAQKVIFRIIGAREQSCCWREDGEHG